MTFEKLEQIVTGKPLISYEVFEGEDYVVTLNGKPIGQTMSKSQAHHVSRWLQTAIFDLTLGLGLDDLNKRISGLEIRLRRQENANVKAFLRDEYGG